MKKLNQILNGIQYKGLVDERSIEGITYDSRKVKKNFLFIAINGYKNDGHRYIDKAIKLGAVAIVIDSNFECKNTNIPIIRVKNSRQAMSKMSANFFNNCSSKIKIVGITGTNGKTTVTQLVDYILKYNNYASSSIGTLGFQGPNGLSSTGFTTPESVELQNMLQTLSLGGITHLTMEISSHALSLSRVDDVNVDIAVFTNLTAEHLDFYKNMEEYFNAKLKLFKKLDSNKIAIINNDNKYSKKIKNYTKAKILTFGFNSKSTIYPEKITMTLEGSKFVINFKKQKIKVMTKLIGDFNISNILASILICDSLGLEINKIVNAIENFTLVPGRFESFKKNNNGTIIVDYAHTPDAFEKMLSLIKKIDKQKKIITLFGCGGDRDNLKRPLLGQISDKYSDKVIITDDNPRFENPKKIINDIISGFKSTNYSIINDRKVAIEKAITKLTGTEVLMILGKGIENYQIVNNKKYNHNDVDIVKSLI
jgi:UDP-N-acetylmuramoyl-L-alanyl-D-glutamate--2,6-diaminopimelate ligase